MVTRDLDSKHSSVDRRARGPDAVEDPADIGGARPLEVHACVSPVLATFLEELALSSWHHGTLTPYLRAAVGSADDGHDERRGWMCADWLVRTHAASWLAFAGEDHGAELLRGLAEVHSEDSLVELGSVIEEIRSQLNASCAASQLARPDSPWSGACAAASRAAYEAAWDAAFHAAWYALTAAATAGGWLPASGPLNSVRWVARDAAWRSMHSAALDGVARAAPMATGHGPADGDPVSVAVGESVNAALARARRQVGQPLERSAVELLTRMSVLVSRHEADASALGHRSQSGRGIERRKRVVSRSRSQPGNAIAQLRAAR